jgi:chromosomal replication initiator protein
MQQASWREFIRYISENKKNNSVINSILKQANPVEASDTEITLECDNDGARMYLERKKIIVELMLAEFFKKKLTASFTTRLVKDNKKELPLMGYTPPKEDAFIKAGLNPKYTFDNYAVSGSNQVAYAASQAVARNPGHLYNPLFFYGGVGVGKTHLAQAIAREILEGNAEKKVLFSAGDKFTNELIESIREKSQPKFRRKHRHLAILIIDDIQFIAGKVAVQEEFFHTFNEIVSAGGQIILTSDRPPSDIKNLEDRLRSRFSGGLIVDIQSPDFELKTAILLIKAKEKGIEIDIEAAKVIADNVGDAREIEGKLMSLYVKILGQKDRIDLDVVESFFQGQVDIRVKKINSADVMRIVCSFYNVKPSHIKSATRVEDIALPRQIIMYILRKELRLKLEEIADILRKKDHTTVMHGVDKIERKLLKDPVFKQEIDRIVSTLNQST